MAKSIWKALRFFSLTIAFISTSLGISMAFYDGELFKGRPFYVVILMIVLSTLVGLFVQAGVNLVNDYFEGKYDSANAAEKKYRFLGMERTKTEICIFLCGILCFFAGSLIGLLLVYFSNAVVLAIGIIGVIGGYFYTGYPFNYKDKGLGPLFSFVLMGPLMICGAYYLFALKVPAHVILASLSVGLLIPALHISNELRDIERDRLNGIATFSVRFGFSTGLKVYKGLVVGSYMMTVILVLFKVFPLFTLATLVTVPMALNVYKLHNVDRVKFVPATAKLHFVFGLILVGALVIAGF
ncbi:prenyltransferase [Caldanaerobius polysaccharolyticus]|uniref:prenyltransferase n=1 Tax=Caldanaerobius polysaccharolyticus TaxID=44256 RepID=UPI00068D0453|nr:prenyltransferase [Caldanaerobius polysaccharolyticus]